jgi:HSP20 family protein
MLPGHVEVRTVILTSFDPFVEFERQFGRLSRRPFGQDGFAVMPMDGIRRDNEVELRFDLPGIEPDSIEVTVDRNVLSVRASREEKYGEDERAFIRERRTGSFARRVYLPEHLDAGAVEASYHDGVLTVRIPVQEKAQPRKIEIQRAGASLPAADDAQEIAS